MGVRETVERLRKAQQKIVRVAAKWQAAGHDTSPLVQPLIDIQDSIADLESLPSLRAVLRKKRARNRAAGGR